MEASQYTRKELDVARALPQHVMDALGTSENALILHEDGWYAVFTGIQVGATPVLFLVDMQGKMSRPLIRRFIDWMDKTGRKNMVPVMFRSDKIRNGLFERQGWSVHRVESDLFTAFPPLVQEPEKPQLVVAQG